MTILNEIIQFVTKLGEINRKAEDMKLEASVLSLYVFLESRTNLELIDSVRTSKMKDKILNTDEDFKSVINLLETDYLELMLRTMKGNKNIVDELDNQFVFKDMPKGKNKSEKSPKTTLQLMCNLYVKIHAIKKIVNIERNGKALKDIQYKTRLQNIKSKLHDLRIVLKDSAIEGLKQKA